MSKTTLSTPKVPQKSKSSCFKHREEKNSPNKTIKNAESNPAIKRSVVRVFHTPTQPQQQPNIAPENARAFDAVCAGKSFSNLSLRGVRKAQLFFLRGEKAKICNSWFEKSFWQQIWQIALKYLWKTVSAGGGDAWLNVDFMWSLLQFDRVIWANVWKSEIVCTEMRREKQTLALPCKFLINKIPSRDLVIIVEFSLTATFSIC